MTLRVLRGRGGAGVARLYTGPSGVRQLSFVHLGSRRRTQGQVTGRVVCGRKSLDGEYTVSVRVLVAIVSRCGRQT